MKITTDTPDLLVLRFTRWKGPLIYAVLTLFYLALAALLVSVANVSMWVLLVWLLATVTWSLPFALFRVEKSMLVLNALSGEAELRHRDIRGLHRHTWPLAEVQSTRVTRHRPKGAATDDPTRMITLFVREGMDEGRHKLANYTVNATDALEASASVSNWMKDWRARTDSSVDSDAQTS